MIHLQLVLSLHLQHPRRESAHMTQPCPPLRNKWFLSQQESIALFRNRHKLNLPLSVVMSHSLLFLMTCSIPNCGELLIPSLSLTHSRIRRCLHHHLVPYRSLPPVLLLRLPLPQVLRLALVFLATVLGLEGTLTAWLVTRCHSSRKSFIMSVHRSDLIILSCPLSCLQQCFHSVSSS